MTEQIQRKLSDSKAARWTALAIVAFTMLCGYFLTDVMSPLKPMLEEELAWTSTATSVSLPALTAGLMYSS